MRESPSAGLSLSAHGRAESRPEEEDIGAAEGYSTPVEKMDEKAVASSRTRKNRGTPSRTPLSITTPSVSPVKKKSRSAIRSETIGGGGPPPRSDARKGTLADLASSRAKVSSVLSSDGDEEMMDDEDEDTEGQEAFRSTKAPNSAGGQTPTTRLS